MFNFDKRPKKLFFCVGLNKPFFPNPTAPLGCNWTSLEINPGPPNCKVNGTVGLDTTLTPRSSMSTVPLGWYPSWSGRHRWVGSYTPFHQKATAPLSWITPSSAQPSQSQRHRWVGFHTPFPPKGNVGFALLSQPLPSSPYMAAWCSDLEMHASPHTSFLHARALFLKQYTKQTINTIFTIFPTTTTK